MGFVVQVEFKTNCRSIKDLVTIDSLYLKNYERLHKNKFADCDIGNNIDNLQQKMLLTEKIYIVPVYLKFS